MIMNSAWLVFFFNQEVELTIVSKNIGILRSEINNISYFSIEIEQSWAYIRIHGPKICQRRIWIKYGIGQESN